jgi:hypothetical protein
MLHLEFTHIFTTNFVDPLYIRASRRVFPFEVRSPEIGIVECWIDGRMGTKTENRSQVHIM